MNIIVIVIYGNVWKNKIEHILPIHRVQQKMLQKYIINNLKNEYHSRLGY